MKPAKLTASIAAPAVSTPAGFSIPLNGGSVRRPGIRPLPTTMAATPASTSQTTGRQRRDGGFPSGNSRNSSDGTANSEGANSQLPSQAPHSAPGSAPGSAKRP